MKKYSRQIAELADYLLLAETTRLQLLKQRGKLFMLELKLAKNSFGIILFLASLLCLFVMAFFIIAFCLIIFTINLYLHSIILSAAIALLINITAIFILISMILYHRKNLYFVHSRKIFTTEDRNHDESH